MKIINGGRRSGRTTQLIEMALESRKRGETPVIVCHSNGEADRINRLLKNDWDSEPINVITYDEAINLKGSPQSSRYFVDNAEFLIRSLFAGQVNGIVIGESDET